MRSKINYFRKKYPEFIYESFSYAVSKNNLEIFFNFKIGNEINFSPKILIENIDKKRLAKIEDKTLKNLIFNIGLAEIPTYWKTVCSPKIVIKSGNLDRKQITWWKSLFLKGMSQFFYENKIDWRKKDFLNINSSGKKFKQYKDRLKDRYLVPFAGGRDSIVSVETLKEKNGKDKIFLFTLNPIEKIQKSVKVTEVKKQIIVRRTIDRDLLDLNKVGYFNGHTPFTSLLSFISVLCAVLFDCKNIAFSNEKSANEGNLKYLGREINHQWAKSSVFEKMFKEYCLNYLAKEVNYFSFTRKYGELEISKILTKYPKYFPVFSSCNAGMKILTKSNERWCCECPKCLFVYLSLYPFLKEQEINKIFGKNIFENKKLLPVMKGLLGRGAVKPFECVGTKKEVLKAMNLCLKKSKNKKLPYLLNYFKNNK